MREAGGTGCRAAVVLLVSAVWLGGCVVEKHGSGTFQLVVKDAQTRCDLDGSLYLFILNRTETRMTTCLGGGRTTACGSNQKDVGIRVLNSGQTVHQPVIIRPFVSVGLASVTDYGYYSHAVVREGYVPAEFRLTGGPGPVAVRLQRQRPGEPDSDRQVVLFAEKAVNYLVPALSSASPLRTRLVDIVTGQLVRVMAASRNPQTLRDARAALGELNRLEQKRRRSRRLIPPWERLRQQGF